MSLAAKRDAVKNQALRLEAAKKDVQKQTAALLRAKYEEREEALKVPRTRIEEWRTDVATSLRASRTELLLKVARKIVLRFMELFAEYESTRRDWNIGSVRDRQGSRRWSLDGTTVSVTMEEHLPPELYYAAPITGWLAVSEAAVANAFPRTDWTTSSGTYMMEHTSSASNGLSVPSELGYVEYP